MEVANHMKKLTFRPFILPLLMLVCTVFYYFGELIDWAAWDALRNSFFYGIHDVHRLLFLAPIVYAGYNARIKGAVIVTLVSFIIFLPRAFFISPFPDPLLRMVIFTIFAGVIGSLVGAIRNQTAKATYLESTMVAQRDRILEIVNCMADGIIITGPDYRIRYMNSRMVKDFGDGTGSTCYEHLKKYQAPCEQNCYIMAVIDTGEISQWECKLPNGRTYEVMAAPFIDTDGTTCQISIFRDISQRRDA
jgi:PAS domain-containing protein